MLQVDFALARLNHQVWKMRLRAFLSDKEEMEESEASEPTECELGKWIYSVGLTDFSHLPEIKELEQTHAELHQYIKDVVVLKKAGQVQKANEQFKKVSPLSDEVVQLLTQIERKAKLGAAA
jgi:hypothetical protein